MIFNPLRIHHGDGIGDDLVGFMVIRNNHINTECFCLFDRFAGIGSAIDRNDERRAVLLNANHQ